MSPDQRRRARFCVVIVMAWIAIGFSIPVDGPPGAGLAMVGITLSVIAIRLSRKGDTR